MNTQLSFGSLTGVLNATPGRTSLGQSGTPSKPALTLPTSSSVIGKNSPVVTPSQPASLMTRGTGAAAAPVGLNFGTPVSVGGARTLGQSSLPKPGGAPLGLGTIGGALPSSAGTLSSSVGGRTLPLGSGTLSSAVKIPAVPSSAPLGLKAPSPSQPRAMAILSAQKISSQTPSKIAPSNEPEEMFPVDLSLFKRFRRAYGDTGLIERMKKAALDPESDEIIIQIAEFNAANNVLTQLNAPEHIVRIYRGETINVPFRASTIEFLNELLENFP